MAGKRRSAGFVLLGVLVAWLGLVATAQGAGPAIALVIDDLGYSVVQGERAIALPGPLAVGVLPFAPNAARLANQAAAAGREVILHQPMQARSATVRSPGELTAEMSDADLRAQLDRALARVPQAVGVNNHTGSLLTAQPGPMHTLMAQIRERGLFFLDSRTTAATVAHEAALVAGVPALRRDVFLDHVVHPAEIAREFERAVAIARAQGHAVIIGHPHAVTLDFLSAELPALAERGIRQVTLTALLGGKAPQHADASPSMVGSGAGP